MIYLDNAATTCVSAQAAQAAFDAMTQEFANPSSLHSPGIRAEHLLDEARSRLATALGCDKQQVHFTSGGTEANNLAVLGAANAMKRKCRHIVVSAIEHPSVLECAKQLEKDGWRVSYIASSDDGHISAEDVADAVCEDTALVSVMCVNNEVGAIQPIGEICKAVKRRNAATLVHSDCVQALFKVEGRLCDTGADILTVSAHKLHAPKGAGAIYVKKGVRLLPNAHGGGQEKAIRPGTEPVPAIAGFGAACGEWLENGQEWRAHMRKVLDHIIRGLSDIDGLTVIGGSDAPHILSVSPGRYPSEVIMRMLEQRGIYVSSGSACSKGRRSHVLSAMGVKPNVIDSAVRISLSHDTTEDDADELISAMREICKRG